MKSFTLDIQNPASINEFASGIAGEFPATNVLINNSGIMQIENLTAPPVDLSSAEAMTTTNLLGPIRLTMAL